jgi:uncharacterized Ntn-hydrolase superfamily protein
MEIENIIQIIIGSGGVLGIAFLVFRTGRIVEKIESSDKKISEIKDDIKEVRRTLNLIEIQIGKLETRVEERTLRVIHVENSDREMASR